MSGWPEGYGRFVVGQVSSTLDEAVVMAARTSTPFWLLAHMQTEARGRRGRPWVMPQGNFAATLVLHTVEPPGVVALRSFAMSLALLQAFVEATGREAAFSLKWPNDVLLHGGKVAGILLEKSGSDGLLALGVGVNLLAGPAARDLEPGALRPVSLAGETGVRVAPEDFLDLLARHYARLEVRLRTEGFAPLRRDWLAQAARLGEVITARRMHDEIIGVFEDVDGDGNLMLRTDEGLQAIAAADVYF